jgi:hypothetical protein
MEWKKLEEIAMEERGERLKIYDVASSKGLLQDFFLGRINKCSNLEPNCAEILLDLMQKERKVGGLSGIASLLATGLDLEESQ